VIGRYLEHARLYYFANGWGEDQSVVYMGSADLMQRNLDHRVESLVAITDTSIAERLVESLQMDLEPNLQSWDLAADGSWRRDARDGLVDLHRSFEKLAIERRKSSKQHSASRG